MAGLIIGKLGFGKDEFFYGLELCLSRAGRTAYPVTPKTAKAVDILLVTAFWYKDLYLLAQFLEDAGIDLRKSSRPRILIGGMQATMTPRAFAEFGDWVFVGDGDDHLGPILDAIEAGREPDNPYLYRRGDTETPRPAECSPTAFVLRKGGARDTARIEIARGCVYKCHYCALSGLKPFREVPVEAVLAALAGVPRRSPVVLFAPERTQHSKWAEIQRALADGGWRDLGQDVRLENLHQIAGATANIGIEGISYRLRKAIGKPFKQTYLLDRVGDWVASRKGVAMLSAYFIADLPGEDESDWEECRGLFEAIERADWSRRLTLKPVLNPLSPKPFTPLADAAIHPFRDYQGRWSALLRKGGSQWGFRIVETLVWPPSDRILDVVVQRGGALAGPYARSLTKQARTKRPRMEHRTLQARQLLRLASEMGMSTDLLRVEV